MPESLVVNLVSESTIPFQYLRGHHLYRLFLALISTVDTDLAHSLQTHRYHGFALSPLQIASQPQPASARNLKFLLPPQRSPFQYANKSVPAGSHCWWRLALLDDVLFAHIGPRLKQTVARKTWYLGPSKLHVTNFVPVNSHEWASHNSYQQLYKQASDRNRQITIQLLTPAVFHQGKYASPLPSRDALFHSLRRCWNRYSGLVFAPNTILPITVQTFNLRTVPLALGNSKTIVGCLGELTFQILENTDPLVIKRINALTDFSRYCGIGDKTHLGLGMVHIKATK
ncbi:MAG: CRISPR-associated endoribonuclease Cas6 [Leptolyngbyaceae cyanobacterium]